MQQDSQTQSEYQEQSEQQAPSTRTGRSGVSRRTIVQRAAIAGLAVAPVGFIMAAGRMSTGANAPAIAKAARVSRASGTATVNVAKAFMEIQQDENAHVAYLQDALKSAARPKPTFKGLEQPNLTMFETVSRALENTGVGAYLLGASAISSKDILLAAASILTIEARHAGFLNVLQDQPLSPNGAFDKAIPQDEIVAAASPFIASLNGGSDPAAKLSSDTDILNFALLLEFLESEFYNINVPKFFGTVGQG